MGNGGDRFGNRYSFRLRNDATGAATSHMLRNYRAFRLRQTAFP